MKKLDYKVVTEEDVVDEDVSDKEIEDYKNRFMYSAIFGLPLLYIAMAPHLGIPIPDMSDSMMAILQFIFATPILFFGSFFL